MADQCKLKELFVKQYFVLYHCCKRQSQRIVKVCRKETPLRNCDRRIKTLSETSIDEV